METKYEIERKFLARAADLRELDGLRLTKIRSVYLDPVELEDSVAEALTANFELIKSGHTEMRVQKYTDGESDETSYWAVSKVGDYSLTRAEAVSEITEDMFNSVVAKHGRRELTKTRFTFDYLRRTFELDVLDDGETLLLEVELSSEGQLFAVPPFVDIVREVTGDPEYYGYNLATEITQ